MEPIITADENYWKSASKNIWQAGKEFCFEPQKCSDEDGNTWRNETDAKRCNSGYIDFEYYEKRARSLRSEAVFLTLKNMAKLFLKKKQL